MVCLLAVKVVESTMAFLWNFSKTGVSRSVLPIVTVLTMSNSKALLLKVKDFTRLESLLKMAVRMFQA